MPPSSQQDPTRTSGPGPGLGPGPGPGLWEPETDDLAILDGLARGRTVEAIARGLEVSERTVRRRTRAIADELGVDSTIEAVVHAVRAGLI